MSNKVTCVIDVAMLIIITVLKDQECNLLCEYRGFLALTHSLYLLQFNLRVLYENIQYPEDSAA